jgi:hypothetical protein
VLQSLKHTHQTRFLNGLRDSRWDENWVPHRHDNALNGSEKWCKYGCAMCREWGGWERPGRWGDPPCESMARERHGADPRLHQCRCCGWGFARSMSCAVSGSCWLWVPWGYKMSLLVLGALKGKLHVPVGFGYLERRTCPCWFWVPWGENMSLSVMDSLGRNVPRDRQ